MIDVEVQYVEEIVVRCSPDDAYALVSDIYRSGMHFPAVETLTPVDDAGRWRWKIREKGMGPVKLRPTYDVVYACEPERGVVTWRPASGGTNDMESAGTWTITAEGTGARMRFDAQTICHIPGPRLMAPMVDAFAREELLRMKRSYVAAVAKTLNQ
jgi:hypothetical protein